jgi:hypothetical protein
MPRDSDGKPLRAGDRVTMAFEVLMAHGGEIADQVTLVAVDVTGSAGAANRPTITCNAKFATKAGEG